MLTTAEDAVLAAVTVERVTDLAAQLIACPTLSAEETPGQELAAQMLADAGADVERWAIDVSSIASHPNYSAEHDRDVALGVVGRAGRGDGSSLLLDGHIDVVPTGDPMDWTSPPFQPEVRGGRLFGRGACDMKGGLAAAIHAVEAVREAGIRLAGTVLVGPVVGEEDGGAGRSHCSSTGFARMRASSPSRPVSLSSRPWRGRCPGASGSADARLTAAFAKKG
jgi:acetylornithine deacetylase